MQVVPQERVPNRTRERVLNRTQEQLVDVPVPQIMEAAVENCVGEQIVDCPVPQFMGADVEIVRAAPLERVQNRALEQIADFPVPQNMEDYAGVVRAAPQERVQNRIPEPIVDVPVPHIKQDGLLLVLQERVHNRAVSTWKVFTVKLRHHRDDHACSGYVGFIKGLDKHNMPRSGDVMVPALQIQVHLVPRQGSTMLSGADIACFLGVLKPERSWEASLPPEMLRELQEVRRNLYELNAFSEEEDEEEDEDEVEPGRLVLGRGC